MYFVFLELEHDCSATRVGDYFTDEQLQNMIQKKQKGSAQRKPYLQYLKEETERKLRE